MRDLLYYVDFGDIMHGRFSLPEGYYYTIWRPTLLSIKPKGFPFYPFSVWWLFHMFCVFKNKDFCTFIIYKKNEVAHYLSVSPGYFRFPFMGEKDLTIGDSWTNPNHRGKGLYTFMLDKTVELFERPGRRFWTILSENNVPSVKAHGKAQFKRYGMVVRTKRFGIRLFGSFEITSSPRSVHI